MKLNLSILTGVASLATLMSGAFATSAVTDPVGYVTTAISAAFSPTSPKNNVIAPILVNPTEWAGTVASVVGNKVNLTSAALPTSPGYNASQLTFSFTAYAYYIETADGYWAQIVSNDATSVTLLTGAAVNFDVNEAVRIRRHLNISDYFGATNSAGLLANAGGDTGAADNIIIIDEVNGGTQTVIASSALGGNWITDGFEDAQKLPIYPNQGVQVLRRGATNLSLVHTATVDVLPRQNTVTTGIQIRPYAIPTDTTLTALTLYSGNPATGVVGSSTGDTAQADIITILSNGIPTNYFYSTIDLGGGVGWYDDGLAFAGSTTIPAGSGLIINRANPTNSSPFTWVKPAPTIAP